MNDQKSLDQLLNAIRIAAHNPDLEWTEPPTPIAGGFWAQLWRIRLTLPGDRLPTELDGDLVARVMPTPEVAARETRVQGHLAQQGFPTPSVRLHAGPTQELAKAWMLMDFVEGQPLMPSLSSPTMLLRLPGIARSMPDTLARCAADLHRTSTQGLADELGEQANAEQFLSDLHDMSMELDDSELSGFARSLKASQPEPDTNQTVLCHGDLHPFNVLVDSTGSASSYVALDWSAARLSDRCHDLAFTHLMLSNPPIDVPSPLTPIIGAAGRLLAGRFLKKYQEFSGATVDPARFTWHTRLHALRMLVEIGQWKQAGDTESRDSHPFLLLEPHLRQNYLLT